jgi:hypothetical protein
VSPQHFGLFSGHVPHEIWWPQLFRTVPHTRPVQASVLSVHPHTFSVPPPPQVCGAVHVPQLVEVPQPLKRSPQFAPCSAQVTGVVPHVPSSWQHAQLAAPPF